MSRSTSMHQIGGNQIKQVVSTRCLGLQIDCNLGWSSHVSDLILSFSQKLNLLKSLYFLPINAKLDFYFKVVLPSITYGILIWGSCGKTLFDEYMSDQRKLSLAWIGTPQEKMFSQKWSGLREGTKAGPPSSGPLSGAPSGPFLDPFWTPFWTPFWISQNKK
jgi:hypothetical protein